MKKLPKIKEFKTPEDYFEQLPDRIMGSLKPNRNITWISYAAVIALFISVGTWLLLSPEIKSPKLSLEEEVNLYIDSSYWTAEDVLSMAENPDEILDQIINEEFPEGTILWEEETQNWF